jgi:Cu(I)/Ag(I) efflux system membrane fusion protein/cobalt-zinc-cadmium efflux system membrane fusion protein
MNDHRNGRNYQHAFVMAVIANIALVLGLFFLWLHFQRTPPQSAQQAGSGTTASPTPDKTANSFGMGSTETADVRDSEGRMLPVQLTPQRMQSIGVKFGKAQIKVVHTELRVTGNVDVDERKLATVQTRFPGWIRNVFADATYDYVRKGQPLFTIYSPDLVTTEQEYLLARKNQQRLQSSSVSGVADEANSLVGAARARLEQWEIPESEIATVESTGKVITDLTINSPVSGFIEERNALPNMYVQPETKLYTVADLSTVWVYAQVFQTDLGQIKPHDSAAVTVDAYPGRTFHGKVDSILPEIDMNTRTARVRLVFSNPALALKPGMFVTVVLQKAMGKVLTIPVSAIFHSGVRNLVFINKGQGNLEPREVSLGRLAGEDYIVLAGIKPGESLVTSADFLIDSEAQLQAAAGAFVPPPPGAGGAAAMNEPSNAAQTQIELTTDPTPPRKGSNVLRIKLTGANGNPISGAQVNLTFFMPAMPAMGMAAMKTSVDFTDKGDGMYEGKGDLGSGGTWQVTITARQNGKVIGSKQFTVNATGGM